MRWPEEGSGRSIRIRLTRLFDPVAHDTRERLVPFRVLVLLVHAGLVGDLLTDLGATLFDIFAHGIRVPGMSVDNPTFMRWTPC